MDNAQPDTAARSIRRHPTFFMEQLFVQVQDTLFQIPRVAFEGREGSPFADAASLPTQQEPNTTAEGSTADKPVILPVEVSDFESLLHVMYASGLLIPNYPSDISNDQWKGALRLATLWNFDDIRTKAIKALETNTITDPIERIFVAREFRIRSWLISGYGELITGPAEALKPSSCAATLGWEALALIYYAHNEYGTGPSQDPEKLAEYLNSGNSGIGYKCPSCPKRRVTVEVYGGVRKYMEPTDHHIGSHCERLGETISFYQVSQPESRSVGLGADSPSLVSLIERIFADELVGMDA